MCSLSYLSDDFVCSAYHSQGIHPLLLWRSLRCCVSTTTDHFKAAQINISILTMDQMNTCDLRGDAENYHLTLHFLSALWSFFSLI